MSHSSSMMHHISLARISKTFFSINQAVTLLKDISISFTQGKSYAISGSSGSGKSTLLHIIAGFESATAGHVYYDDDCLMTLCAPKRQKILQTEIGLVFQQPYVIPELSVLENVLLRQWIFPQEISEDSAITLLRAMGLGEKIYAQPLTLSGGEQQRVVLARALLMRPKFLLADEPTGNLDATTGAAIIELMMWYQKQYSMGLIISSHDERIIRSLDVQLHLHQGILSR